MTHQEFQALLMPLALAMRAELDVPTWRAYYRALKDVSPAIFAATIEVTLREPREFFPKAGELRGLCERQRRQLLALHPYDGCVECEDSKGWRAVWIAGVARVERCPCLARHQAKLKTLGLLEAVSALPGEAGAGDEAVYPTVEQLPASMRQQVREGSAQKMLR